MTFIDNNAEKPSAVQITLFAITTFCFTVCSIIAARRGHTRRHYHNVWSIRYLFPFACFLFALENLSLAISGYWIDRQMDHAVFLKVVFVLQALEVPLLLMTEFELTYLVHKRRSVNFCWMFFDEGRRVSSIITTPMKSFIARNFIRILGFFMGATGIFVNLDLLKDVSSIDVEAGRTGWSTIWKSENDLETRIHVFLSLIPTAVLILCSFFLSMCLWRYGTESSMVVHSSIFNPWFYPFFGTLALTGGQLFGTEWYSFTKNLGFLILIITLLLLMLEVDRDINETVELMDFLNQVSKKGDEISVRWRDDQSETEDETPSNL